MSRLVRSLALGTAIGLAACSSVPNESPNMERYQRGEQVSSDSYRSNPIAKDEKLPEIPLGSIGNFAICFSVAWVVGYYGAAACYVVSRFGKGDNEAVMRSTGED